MLVSPGGLMGCRGASAMGESEYSETCCAAADSLTFARGMTRPFFWMALKANRALGTNFARVSWSFSNKALMAWYLGLVDISLEHSPHLPLNTSAGHMWECSRRHRRPHVKDDRYEPGRNLWRPASHQLEKNFEVDLFVPGALGDIT